MKDNSLVESIEIQKPNKYGVFETVCLFEYNKQNLNIVNFLIYDRDILHDWVSVNLNELTVSQNLKLQNIFKQELEKNGL